MALSIEQLKKMYFEMVQIRRFEEKVDEYSKKGYIPGFVHLGIGQEAAQVGVVNALKITDYKFPDHRCHGAIMLFGTKKELVMAEIFGKATGINGGRGGSMHIADLSVRNMGNNGIQGANVLTALGTAFAAKYRGTDDVTAVFLGDGTLGEGACHESMNLAAVWKLPLVYVLVNNQYAISTHYTESHPQKQLATWANGYEVPNEVIDGNDVEAVYYAATRAIERARKGAGPTLLELMSYRWQGHFAGDPAAYRPEAEVKAWKEKCPITKLKEGLLAAGVAQEILTSLEDRAVSEVEDMVKFALASEDPKPEDALKYVYADREVETRS